MNGKLHMSVKTKKILLGTGIAFGTILIFIVSFFLSFSLIINPINFGSDNVAVESEEPENQEQTKKESTEQRKDDVEKPKKNVEPPATVTVPKQTAQSDAEEKPKETAPSKAEEKPKETTPSKPEEEPEGTTPPAETPVEEPNSPADSNPTGNMGEGGTTDGEEFTPDTVTTPEGGSEPETEPGITVIDVSE